MSQMLWLPDLRGEMEDPRRVRVKNRTSSQQRGEVKGERKKEEMSTKHLQCARCCAQHCPI